MFSLQPRGGPGVGVGVGIYRAQDQDCTNPSAAKAAPAPVRPWPLIRCHRAVPSILPPTRRAESSPVSAFNKLKPFARCIHWYLLPQGRPHGVSLSALQVNRGFCVRQGKQSCPNGDPVGSRYASPARANGGHSLELLSTRMGDRAERRRAAKLGLPGKVMKEGMLAAP